MFSLAVWCTFALMEIKFVSFASRASLSNECALWFTSIPTKLYLTSIDKVGSRLYVRKNGEDFVELCLLILCVNKIISIIFGQSRGLPPRTVTNEFLMVLFWRLQIPFCWGWYAEAMRWSVPTILCKTLLTSFTNFFL